MGKLIYSVEVPEEYLAAGYADLIRLLPPPKTTPVFLEKRLLEMFVVAVVEHAAIHLSGPTGTAKSSLIEALDREPENFRQICKACRLPYKPIRLFPVEMATFETPGELYQRRAIRDGQTYDERSILVGFLEEASRVRHEYYPLIHLREIGRVHASCVQGGLLNLMCPSQIDLPDGERLDALGIGWLADSNYQAEQDARHTLVPLDEALARRFSVNLTLDYLGVEQEREVLRELCGGQASEEELRIVKLGSELRKQRNAGSLQSVPPPTIAGYLNFVKLARRLPSLGLKEVAKHTVLGNASNDDRKQVEALLNAVFGLAAGEKDDSEVGENLF